MHHDPVLINEVESAFVDLPRRRIVVDATLGLGGHAAMLLSHMPPDSIFIGFDRDRDNLALAESHLERSSQIDKHLVHASFDSLSSTLETLGLREIDWILYDLWVSSAHYDDGDRGFSLRFDAPLDMRFDRTGGQTARDLVNTQSERELMQMFIRYADEKKALFIARAIVEARKNKEIETTTELSKIISDASFDKKSPLRVFQALRIAVNQEFEHIESSLRQAIDRLALGGRIAVITFHSIEDRIVKNLLSEYMQPTIDDFTGQIIVPARLKKYTKKPIEPTEQEIQENPRSRSAKLRIVERVS